MPTGWKAAIIVMWIVTVLGLAYLIWGHVSQRNWARAMKHATVSGHHAQDIDLQRLGIRVSALDNAPWVPTVPTPGDWPPPDPPEWP